MKNSINKQVVLIRAYVYSELLSLNYHLDRNGPAKVYSEMFFIANFKSAV